MEAERKVAPIKVKDWNSRHGIMIDSYNSTGLALNTVRP
jgi:hypothetical protein